MSPKSLESIYHVPLEEKFSLEPSGVWVCLPEGSQEGQTKEHVRVLD